VLQSLSFDPHFLRKQLAAATKSPPCPELKVGLGTAASLTVFARLLRQAQIQLGFRLGPLHPL